MIQKTEQQAYQALAALCARSEHCQWDVAERLRRWQMDDETTARIMQRLVRERYVDDERYARALVKDKVTYNRWGRRKVEQALWQKHIDEDTCRRVLDEVDDQAYLNTLRQLLQQKRRTTKADSDYAMRQKLIRFALGRGYSYDLTSRCLDELELGDE